MIISRGGFAYFSIASGVRGAGKVLGRFPKLAFFQSLDFSKCVDRPSLLLEYGRQVRGGLRALGMAGNFPIAWPEASDRYSFRAGQS